MNEIKVYEEGDKQTNSSLKLSKNSKELDNIDINDMGQRKLLLKQIDDFGADVLKNAEQKGKSFNSTVSSISANGLSDELYKNIDKLENEIRVIDPSNIDFSKVAKGLGKMFSPVTQYFNKLEHEDDRIEELIKELDTERSVLSNDNITLELEVEKINEVIKSVDSEYENGQELKEKILKIIENAKQSGDSAKVRFFEEEILTPLEKKLVDLKQLSIVNTQTILAINIICKNNKELIRNIDRIKNITLVAVNTAVLVAKSIYNQKIVLKKISSLEDSSKNAIDSTNYMLKHDGTMIANEIKVKSCTVEDMKESFKDLLDLIEVIKNKEESKE